MKKECDSFVLFGPKVEIMLPARAGSNIIGREMACQIYKRSSQGASGSDSWIPYREGKEAKEEKEGEKKGAEAEADKKGDSESSGDSHLEDDDNSNSDDDDHHLDDYDDEDNNDANDDGNK